MVNRGSGTKRYSGWQTGLRFNTGKPKPVLSTFPAPFVIDRRAGARPCCCGARCARTPSRRWTLQIRPRGEAELPAVYDGHDRPRRHLRRTGTSIATGAPYRYRWTPLPTLADPLPRPRESGVVDLGRREDQHRTRRRWRSEAPATIPRPSTPRATRSRTASESLKLGRWRELGARTKAAHAVALCAGRPGRPPWSRSAAATARCWPSSRRPGRRRASTASSSPRRRSRSPARAGSARVGRLEAYRRRARAGRGRRVRPRRALARARARPGPAAAAARGRARRPPRARRGAAGGQPLRPRGRRKRAEAERIGHLHAFDRAAVRGAASPRPACTSSAS